MSDFTIEQLEALKEGADSAPWRPEYDEGEEHWVIAFDHPKFGGRWDKGVAHGEGAAKLFASAPDLVDALIAEKQAHQETLHLVRELWSDVYNHGNVGRASILRHLTRILEGTE